MYKMSWVWTTVTLTEFIGFLLEICRFPRIMKTDNRLPYSDRSSRLNLIVVCTPRTVNSDLNVLLCLLFKAGPQQDSSPDSGCQRIHVPISQQVRRFNWRERQREQRLHSSGGSQIYTCERSANLRGFFWWTLIWTGCRFLSEETNVSQPVESVRLHGNNEQI